MVVSPGKRNGPEMAGDAACDGAEREIDPARISEDTSARGRAATNRNMVASSSLAGSEPAATGVGEDLPVRSRPRNPARRS
jgi:hypothetical protein